MASILCVVIIIRQILTEAVLAVSFQAPVSTISHPPTGLSRSKAGSYKIQPHLSVCPQNPDPRSTETSLPDAALCPVPSVFY
jgi:hypothetical protein